MKKTYRLTIDYEVEIKEKVKDPGDEEYSPKLLEKTQDIMNAFFKCPDVMYEYIKETLFRYFRNWPAFIDDLGKVIGVKNSEKLMNSYLVKYLPSETVPYLLGLNCPDKAFPGPDKEEADLRWLIISQFGPFILLKASMEEM